MMDKVVIFVAGMLVGLAAGIVLSTVISLLLVGPSISRLPPTAPATITRSDKSSVSAAWATKLPSPPGTVKAVQIRELLIIFNYSETTNTIREEDWHYMVPSRPQEGYRYFLLFLTIKNLGNRETYFDAYDCELEVDKGYIYEGHTTALDWTIRPGDKTYGMFYFEIREDTQPVKFTWFTYGYPEDEVLCTIEFGG